ncbi:unnamed protein product [Haemonchus placei]|uniref:Paraquat-inducible protein B n=1 Tax=Haemonchus placei TaxID=6290 RepID=A0A0N4WYK8_HAEPC|nr:unnamed protein product [Haemonchus placei]
MSEAFPIKDLLQMVASQQKLLVDLLQKNATSTVALQEPVFDQLSKGLKSIPPMLTKTTASIYFNAQ